MRAAVYVATGIAALLVLGAVVARRIRHNLSANVATAPPAPTERTLTPLLAAETAYDEKLGAGWEDWGWGSHELPLSGPARIVFSGYGGILLHHHGELPFHFGGLSFRYQAPAQWPEFLTVSFRRAGSEDSAFRQVIVEPRHVAKLAGGWREVLISAAELNPANLPIDSISLAARSAVTAEGVLIDKVVLTKAEPGAAALTGPTRDVELSVLCRAATHPISPLIYGAALGDWESAQAAQRIGGNPMSRLNWDLANTWNAGSDWFFENTHGDTGLWDWLDAGVKHHVPTAMTVPMLGWVAKNDTSVGFPSAKFAGQRKYDPNRPAGDGYRPDGTPIPPGAPTETSIAAPPEVIGRWIRMLRDKDGERGARAVAMYILDNEPSLWNVTHRDVHPEPLTYDELLDRTIRYASEIRKADPEAVIAGPAEWGWSGYFSSAKDRALAKDRDLAPAIGPDRSAHGGIPLIAWYLQKLAEYEKNHGVRLLDVLDVHFYPAADGLYGEQARTDAEGSALRLRATRALWDPDYRDESWIKEPIQLIPRLKRWVSSNYPGRKISIGEWSFGADAHISGALATAEALGRFGQQGLDSAFYYGGPKLGTGTFWAFRAFRNFDGRGAHFEDTALSTREDEKVSLFASRDAAGTHVVLVVLNRDAEFSVRARLLMDTCGSVSSYRVFGYGRDSSTLLEEPSQPSVDGMPTVTLPSYSLAVVDVRLDHPTVVTE